MLDFANIKDYSLFVFYFVYAVLLPGYLLTRALFPPLQLRKLLKTFPNVEKDLVYRYFYYLFAPAVGLILVDAVVLILAKLDLSLNFTNYFVIFSVIDIVLLLLNIFLVKLAKSNKIDGKETQNFASLHRNYVLIFMALFLGSVLIRTIFYLPDVVPQDTDLGHHMYWSQWMAQKETFPVYDTPEVIEGEHMIFAVLSKLSGITLLSAMPLIVLSFYNLAMLLALSFASLTITANKRVFLWTLFFSGIYFAIDPPQARYIKGGVIGNTFGNLFIPLVFLLVFLFIRYFYKNLIYSSGPIISLISLILIILAGSFYTHHLSTFLLGMTLAASFIFWIILTFVSCRDAKFCVSGWNAAKVLLDLFRRIILSPKFILILLVIAIFPLFIYIPHYLASNAVETVTQAPVKDTHMGVPFSDLPGKLGRIRLVLLSAGVIILLISLSAQVAKRYKIGEKLYSLKLFKYYAETGLKPVSVGMLSLLLFGWFLPLAVLSFYPEMLKVDLPSRRIINYLIFPSIILGAVAANLIFLWIRNNYRGKMAATIFCILALALVWDGTADFRSVYTDKNKFQDTVELYGASEYLARNTSQNAVILKDHRTVSGDSWIKFFFLRGYDYFLSRTYDYKYNAIDSSLDPCTREMIIVPGSKLADDCYGQTGINYVIVKPAGDEFLFWKGRNFDAIYLSDSIAIFKIVKNF